MYEDELWVAFRAGGRFHLVWSDKDRLFYVPIFCSHDDALKFWHSRTDDRKAWTIRRIFIEGVPGMGVKNNKVYERSER